MNISVSCQLGYKLMRIQGKFFSISLRVLPSTNNLAVKTLGSHIISLVQLTKSQLSSIVIFYTYHESNQLEVAKTKLGLNIRGSFNKADFSV